MNWSRPFLLPLVVFAGWLVTAGVPAGAAPHVTDAVKSGDEIRVPAEYARMKLNRYPDKVPPAEYRVNVDVIPGQKGQAIIAKSSGVRSLDAVALDFADAYSTQIERLREMRKTRELRFPLVFDLRQAMGIWHTKVEKGAVGVRTSLRGFRTYILRVATGPDGRVNRTAVVKTSGLERFDEALAGYAKRHWSGPPNSATLASGYAGTSF